MKTGYRLILIVFVLTMSLAVSQLYAEDGKEDKVAASLAQENWDGKIVQYGTMHEAIGQKQSEGRVSIANVIQSPHFYGVAALEKLKGEATFFNSDATITAVTTDGGLSSIKEKQVQATLLAGAYVSSWSEHTIEKDISPSELDNLIRDKAAESGFDVSKPFVFTLDGEFSEVKLHVINGQCPMHARFRKIEIPAEFKPFEGEYTKISGKVIGIFASNAVGILTHPDTSTHLHLIFKDTVSGQMVTGHVEQLGLVKGTTLKLPLKRDGGV